jgi:hypothetical protein
MVTADLSLALEDFVPVVLSAIALWVLARTSMELDRRCGGYVGAGLLLIAGGGLTKPVYKLLVAVSDGSVDVAALDDLLFWFLAPGFLLLTAGLRGAARTDGGGEPEVGRAALWAAGGVVLLAAVLVAFGSDSWFWVLLVVVTVGNVAAVVVLARWARARGDRVAVALFVTSLLLALGLAWAAASLEQTIPAQWGEQLLSTASQALLLWGSLRLRDRVAARPGPLVKPAPDVGV